VVDTVSYFETIKYPKALLDAFGRIRVSDPKTIFDSKQIFDAAPLFWDDVEESGSGTGSAHSVNAASSTISVGATTAGKRTRQTKRRFNYQPGKGQRILMTGNIDRSGGGTGITRSVGYFDDNNGVFFSDIEGTMNVVQRSKATGSVVDDAVAQSSWNIDKMDGTGPSGVTLDFTKAQIFVMEFEWLGVGAVWYGFVVNGTLYYVHRNDNANNKVTVFMSTPNLPARYQIENDGTGVDSGFETICSSVQSEGGAEETGVVLSTNTGSTQCNADVVGTTYAVLGMKLKSTHLGATVDLLTMSMMGITNNDYFMWEVYLNPTVASTFTYSDITNSAVQRAQGDTANTVSGGTLLNSGTGANQIAETSVLINELDLGATVAGVVDELVLCVTPVAGTNQDIFAALTWRELT
jgi:hypothetical protein